MNQIKNSPFRVFLTMHKVLIKRLYALDILLFFCTSWYLFVPASGNIYPFRTIVLLFLFFLFFIGVHTHFAAAHSGSIGYYRLLPSPRFLFFLKSHLVVMVPFITVLSLIALIGTLFTRNISIDQTVVRAARIAAVFCTIKLLTLPTLFALKRSLFLLPILYSLIIPIALAISAGNECIWGILPLSGAWDMVVYSLLLLCLETVIIKNVKVS